MASRAGYLPTNIPNPKINLFSVDDFSGGLWDGPESHNIPNNAISDGADMHFRQGNVLSTRFGYSKYNSKAIDFSSGIRSLHSYQRKDGSTRYLIIASGGHLYQGNDRVPSPITEALNPALTGNLAFSSAIIDDKMYMVNGTDDCVRLTGTTPVYVSAVPKGTMIVEHRNLLLLAGVAAYPNRLYISGIGNGDTFPNQIDLVDDEGGITGLASVGDSALIFKKTAIYILQGASSSTFSIQRLTPDYGTISHNTIRLFQGTTVFFLDPSGPRIIMMQDGQEPVDLSTMRIPNFMASININQGTKCHAQIWKNQYILEVPTGASLTPNKRIVWDIERGCFCPVWTTGFSASVVHDSGSGLQYYTGHASSGYVYQQDDDKYEDDGAAIADYLVTKDYDLGLSFQQKRTRRLYVSSSLKDAVFGRPSAHSYDASVLPSIASFPWVKQSVVPDPIDNPSTEEITTIDGETVLKTSESGPNPLNTLYYEKDDSELDNNVGTTLEIKIKAETLGGGYSQSTLSNPCVAIIQDGTKKFGLAIIDNFHGSAYVLFGGGSTGGILLGVDVITAPRTFRLTLKGDVGRFYIDGVLNDGGVDPSATADLLAATNQRRITFGDNDIESPGTPHTEYWYYVKYWKTGAYAPGEELQPLTSRIDVYHRSDLVQTGQSSIIYPGGNSVWGSSFTWGVSNWSGDTTNMLERVRVGSRGRFIGAKLAKQATRGMQMTVHKLGWIFKERALR